MAIGGRLSDSMLHEQLVNVVVVVVLTPVVVAQICASRARREVQRERARQSGEAVRKPTGIDAGVSVAMRYCVLGALVFRAIYAILLVRVDRTTWIISYSAVHLVTTTLVMAALMTCLNAWEAVYASRSHDLPSWVVFLGWLSAVLLGIVSWLQYLVAYWTEDSRFLASYLTVLVLLEVFWASVMVVACIHVFHIVQIVSPQMIRFKRFATAGVVITAAAIGPQSVIVHNYASGGVSYEETLPVEQPAATVSLVLAAAQLGIALLYLWYSWGPFPAEARERAPYACCMLCCGCCMRESRDGKPRELNVQDNGSGSGSVEVRPETPGSSHKLLTEVASPPTLAASQSSSST